MREQRRVYWISPVEMYDWDPLERKELEPLRYPERIDYNDEPDHGRKWFGRKRSRKSNRVILCGTGYGYCGHYLKFSWGNIDAWLEAPWRYPKGKRCRAGFAERGFDDRYYQRRVERDRDRAYKDARDRKHDHERYERMESD